MGRGSPAAPDTAPAGRIPRAAGARHGTFCGGTVITSRTVLRSASGVKGFRRKTAPGPESAVPLDRFVRVPREENHLDRRSGSDESVRARTATQTGHDYVGPEEVDRPRVPVGDDQRLSAMTRAEDRVAGVLKDLPDQIADRLLVLDEEGGWRPTPGAPPPTQPRETARPGASSAGDTPGR